MKLGGIPAVTDGMQITSTVAIYSHCIYPVDLSSSYSQQLVS